MLLQAVLDRQICSGFVVGWFVFFLGWCSVFCCLWGFGAGLSLVGFFCVCMWYFLLLWGLFVCFWVFVVLFFILFFNEIVFGLRHEMLQVNLILNFNVTFRNVVVSCVFAFQSLARLFIFICKKARCLSEQSCGIQYAEDTCFG